MYVELSTPAGGAPPASGGASWRPADMASSVANVPARAARSRAAALALTRGCLQRSELLLLLLPWGAALISTRRCPLTAMDASASARMPVRGPRLSERLRIQKPPMTSSTVAAPRAASIDSIGKLAAGGTLGDGGGRGGNGGMGGSKGGGGSIGGGGWSGGGHSGGGYDGCGGEGGGTNGGGDGGDEGGAAVK